MRMAGGRAMGGAVWAGLVLAVAMGCAPMGVLMAGPTEAVDALRERIDRFPLDGRGRTKAKLYNEIGMRLYQEGDFRGAAQAFESALGWRPRAALRRQIPIDLARSYEAVARMDRAIGAYEMALARDPRNWRRYRDLARAQERVLLFRQAAEHYAEAVRLNPRRSDLNIGLARMQRQVGLMIRAEETLRHARNLERWAGDAAAELSLIFEAQGRFSEAAAQMLVAGPVASLETAMLSRLVYLAALGGDFHMANAGLNELRRRPESVGTVRLFEAVVEYLRRSDLTKAIEDADLRPLLDAIGGLR